MPIQRLLERKMPNAIKMIPRYESGISGTGKLRLVGLRLERLKRNGCGKIPRNAQPKFPLVMLSGMANLLSPNFARNVAKPENYKATTKITTGL